MIKNSLAFCLFFFTINTIIQAQNSSPVIQYQYPKDGSQQVNPNTTLIYRFNRELTAEEITEFKVQLISEKKPYPVEYIPAENGRTILVKPLSTLNLNETVVVKLLGDYIPKSSTTYSFQVTPNIWNSSLQQSEFKEFKKAGPEKSLNLDLQLGEEGPTIINGVSVPSDFFIFQPSINEETAPGFLFLSNYTNSPYIFILENDGTPRFYKKLDITSIEFKYQLGYLIYYDERISSYITMDANYQLVDTFTCGIGYNIDYHDIQLMENGHALLIAMESKTIDMSKLVENGDPAASVTGNHIQEIDEEGNVVFEFNCWDNFNILDAKGVILTNKRIDFTHTNSVALDADDNIVVSNRNLNECTKINRQTGEIMWRFGGNNNQFKLINEDDSIDYQHDFRPVPGVPGNYTVFDNGNHRGYSRVVEYRLDTVDMTATKVWEYRHDPEILTAAMGSAQRLPNGNTLVNWASAKFPKATEVTPEGEVVYEGNFVDDITSYRTFRFEWDGYPTKPYLVLEEINDKIRLIYNLFGADSIVEYNIYRGTDADSLELFTTTKDNWIDLKDLENDQRYYFQVSAVSHNQIESDHSNVEAVRIIRPEIGVNLVRNGDFSLEQKYWNFYLFGGTAEVFVDEQEELHFDITDGGANEVSVQIRQNGIPLTTGQRYLFEFDAWADAPRNFVAKVGMDDTPYTNYSGLGATMLSTSKTHYSYEFTMTSPSDDNSRVVFNCGLSNNDVYIDNVSLKLLELQGENAIGNPLAAMVKIYPNPTTDKIFIDPGSQIFQEMTISVYSAEGKVVISRKASRPALYTLNLEEFDEGTYYCHVEYYTDNSQKETVVKQIIKNNK